MLVTLRQVLKKAQSGGYAVGLFNTINTDMLDAAIDAAEQNRSPIIIGTAEVLLSYGELELIAPSIIDRARQASVPVVVHYDHGLTFEKTLHAMKLGFTSVMYDCSTMSEKQNVAATREMAKIAHSFGCSIEAEIGHVGGAEDAADDNSDECKYTSVRQAEDFYAATGVDALAVAVGTAHGAYKVKPILNLSRIREIRDAIDVPLVLHGGSGLTDEDFRNTIHCGIAKVNIFTDLCLAAREAMQRGLNEDRSFLEMRNMQKCAIRDEIVKKMKLFGSIGKA